MFQSRLPPLINDVHVPEQDYSIKNMEIEMIDSHLDSIEVECQRLTKLLRAIDKVGMLPTPILKKQTFGRARDIQHTVRYLRIRLREMEKENYELERKHGKARRGTDLARYFASKRSKIQGPESAF